MWYVSVAPTLDRIVSRWQHSSLEVTESLDRNLKRGVIRWEISLRKGESLNRRPKTKNKTKQSKKKKKKKKKKTGKTVRIGHIFGLFSRGKYKFGHMFNKQVESFDKKKNKKGSFSERLSKIDYELFKKRVHWVRASLQKGVNGWELVEKEGKFGHSSPSPIFSEDLPLPSAPSSWDVNYYGARSTAFYLISWYSHSISNKTSGRLSP